MAEKEITNASTGLTSEDLGGSGPSTDLKTTDFPPGTTGTDDQGNPHNIKGVPTHGAPADDAFFSALVPKEQPKQAVASDDDAFMSALVPKTAAPEDNSPAAMRARGAAANAPGGAVEQFEEKVGSYLNTADQNPTLHNIGARIASSVNSAVNFPFDMYKAFASPATQQEKAALLGQIRTENAKHNAQDPNHPDHIPDDVALNPGHVMMGTYRLFGQPHQALQARADNTLDAARDLWDKGQKGAALSKSISGAVGEIEANVPLMGPMVAGIADKAEKGNIAGAITDIAMLHAFEAADAQGKALIKEHLGISPSAPPSVDPALMKISQVLNKDVTKPINVQGAAEKVGRAAARVPGVKSTFDKFNIANASAEHVAATDAHVARQSELVNARQQAANAERAALDVENKVKSGAANPEDGDNARTEASKAQANAAKAEKATYEAAQRAYDSEQNLNRATRNAGKAAGKPEPIDAEQQTAAHEDFMDAIQPTRSKKGAYETEDLTRANPYMVEEHAKNPAKDIEGVRDNLQRGVDSVDDQMAPTIEKYKNNPIKVTSTTGQPGSLTQIVLEHLQDPDVVVPEGYINDATQELQKYNLNNLTIDEADKLRKQLIAENRATMNQNTWSVNDAYAKDPKFAARQELYDALRDGIHGALDDLGVKGSEGLRQDQASMIRIKNAADQAIRSGNVAKKGSSEVSGVRKVAAKGAKYGAAGVGAAIGGAVGGAVAGPFGAELGIGGGGAAGTWVGTKLAEKIAPPDLTRNQLAVRALDNLQQTHPRPVLDMTGAQPEATTPPVHPRENSPLHTELTHFYDENVGDSTYQELESRFMRDYDRKVQMGLKKDLTTPEQNIHKSIVQERFNELKAAQDAADKAIEEKKQRSNDEATKRAAVAKKAASEPVPGEEAPEQTDDSELKHKKPTGSHVAEASEPVQDTAGLSSQGKHRVNDHELAHHVVAAGEGVKTTDIWSDKHPNIQKGAAASIGYEEKPIVSDEKLLESATPEQILEDTRKWVAIHMGGPAMDELAHGVAFEDNEGAAHDIKRSKQLLEAAGITDPKVQDIEIARGIERAMEHLTQDGVSERIQVEARAREKGLPDTHHFSAGRLERITEVMNNERTTEGVSPKPDGDGGGKKGNKQPNASDKQVSKGDQERSSRSEGKPEGEAGPKAQGVAEAADEFNKAEGRPAINSAKVPHSPERAAQIAKDYEAMQHNPSDPAVQKSYDAAKKDIDKQWDYAQDKMGVKFEPWTKEGQPYANSKEMVKDVKDNKHLYFFQGGELPADHPMMEVDPKTGLSYNEKMRAVHDLFGHAAGDNQFGPKGEENAWNQHRQMFSKEAIPAITTETRGQNSWVNFGEHLKNAEGKIPGKGEEGYVPQSERPYAKNKAGLLPQEHYTPNASETAPKAKVDPFEKAASHFGTTEDVKKAGFIGPDGRMLDFSDGQKVRTLDHGAVSEAVGGTNPRVDFPAETGAMRILHSERQNYVGLHADINHPPTAEQLDRVLPLLKDGTKVEVEFSSQNPAHTGGLGIVSGELGEATDADGLKRVVRDAQRKAADKIRARESAATERSSFANPEQKGDWADNIEKGLASPKGSAGGVNPTNPEAAGGRYGLEIAPELRNQSPITAQGLRDFHSNPEVQQALKAHPNVKIGWDNGGAKPEMNVGASTDNLHAAMEMAKKLDQRAIWDNKTKQEIQTGGKGEKTSFPEYTMDQRMADLKAAEAHPHLPLDMIRDMKPEHLEFLKDKPGIQKNVVKEFNQIDPSIEEAVNVAKAGHALGGWWQRFMDTFKAMGEPDAASQIAQLGPSHTEALKAFHGALSGNKAVEHANKLAWNAYKEWLDLGRPRDREAINGIIARNGEPKGVAAISDTHNTSDKPYYVKDKKGKRTGEVIAPGGVINKGLDTTKLEKLVNSPQMRDVNPEPFTGNAFIDSPVYGSSSGAKKIPSMVGTTAGEGNLDNVVFDTHMKDLYKQAGLTDAKYIADTIHITRAAREMGLKPGEAQEQMWGTVLAIKSMLNDGLSPEEVGEKFGSQHVADVGKDYAQVILNTLENDPDFRETLDGLSKHGFSPTSDKAIARLKEIVAQGQARANEPLPEINRDLLSKTAERIGSTIKGYDAEAARNAPSFNFGANAEPPQSALDKLKGK